MKRVFSSHNEVAHVWASQSQPEGRGGNIFFEDQVIYSYGRHFPVARFAPEFGAVVLFTNRGYSSSTGKHKTIIRGAIPNSFEVVYCSDPTRTAEHNLSQWQERAEQLRRAFANSKHRVTRGNAAVELFRICESAILYCMALKIAAPDWTNETNDEMTARDYVYEMAKAREIKRDAARKEREQLAALKASERLPLWLAGESVPTFDFQYLETMLRVKGESIETTRGAKIPVEDAIKLWPLLLRVKNSGRTLEAGLHAINLGPYRFNSFDGETLIVGCHSIAWSQLERMAIELNLIGETV